MKTLALHLSESPATEGLRADAGRTGSLWAPSGTQTIEDKGEAAGWSLYFFCK